MKPLPFLRFLERCRAGLVPLSVAQRALVRVAFDGENPCDLEGEEREAARQLFGDVDVIPPGVRAVLVMVFGRAAGKSYITGLWLLWRSLTADLSSLAPGQRAYALVVAPRLSLAREVIRYARGAVGALPGVRIDEDTADGFVILREGGRSVAIEAMAASARGTATRGRTFVAAALDECAFFFEVDSGAVVTDVGTFSSITPRILPGGAILLASSAWTEQGLLFDLFSANHGHPVTALAAHGPTLLLRPDDETRAMVERETKRDPENAAREFGALFLGGAAGLFLDPNAIANAIDDRLLLPQPKRTDATYTCAIDPAFKADCAALVIVETLHEVHRAVAIEELRPGRGVPLKPSAVCEHFASIAKAYDCTTVWSDSFYVESIREHMSSAGISVSLGPEGQGGKIDVYARTRELLAEGKLGLPDHGALVSQLRSIVARPSSTGALVPFSPRRRGTGHGDIASALVLAAWAAARGASGFESGFALGPSWLDGGYDPTKPAITGADRDARNRFEDQRGSLGEDPFGRRPFG